MEEWSSSKERRISLGESVSKPSSVHRACPRVTGSASLWKSASSWGTTESSPRNTSSFWAVSRHQPLGCDKCSIHWRGDSSSIWGLRARFEVLVDETVDAAFSDFIAESGFVDDFPQIGALLRPIALLDNTAIHIDEVERAIRSGAHVDGTEKRILGADELVLRIYVFQASHAVLNLDPRSTDQTTYRFGESKSPRKSAGSRSPRKMSCPQVAVKWFRELSSRS